MLLTARILNGFSGVNSFEYAQTFKMTAGEAQDIYFQLVDGSKNPSTQYFFPVGLRYMPASGAVLQCKLQSIDDSKTVTRYASQPYPTLDPSIWKLSVLETDGIAGTLALQLTLIEGGQTRKGVLQQAVQIVDTTQAFC